MAMSCLDWATARGYRSGGHPPKAGAQLTQLTRTLTLTLTLTLTHRSGGHPLEAGARSDDRDAVL